MTQSYDIGDDVTESNEFRAGGTLTDPTTVKFKYQKPDGTETVLVYLTHTEVVKDSTGKYHVSLLPNLPGLWRWRWEGSGNMDVVCNGAFYIRSFFPGIVDKFATVELLGAYLLEDIDQADPIALAALEGATQAIQRYCDQHISVVEDDVVLIDGSGSDVLLLPEFPVIEVSEVVENADRGNTEPLAGPENGSSAQWGITSYGLLIRRGSTVSFGPASATFGKWGERRQSVQVTYSHGYDPIPSDIQLICVAAAARTWAQDGATSEGTGAYNASYAGQPGTLTDDERRILDRHRASRRR